MKNLKIKYLAFALLAALFVFVNFSCKKDIDDLEPATFPTTPEVFIDGFTGGLNYSAFGGSDVTAFDVDTDITYRGDASMRIAVPDVGDPAGAYAGGAYYLNVGRDLSGYDALTFWARASKSATVDIIGFGNDFDESPHVASLLNVPMNTNWKKYIIPIPNAAKLTQERGMFFYSEGPEEGKGYTFWIDEVQFEKLGTIAQPRPSILEGQDQVVPAETGQELQLGGMSVTFNLVNGVDQRVEAAPSYFDFTSTNPSVASISSTGLVTVTDAGDATITAKLGDIDAVGSFTVSSSGEAVAPLAPAPAPTVSPDSVISMFSNVYNNVTIDTWNTGWLYSTAELIETQVAGDDVKKYRNLNFVGIEFSSQTIDATEMTHFHLDIWTPNPTDPPTSFKVLLVDFGPDGNFDGGDDSSFELSFTSPVLASQQWVSLDIPLSNFTGLTSRANLAQLVFSGEVPTVFVDNVYFYQGDGTVNPGGPTVSAPNPTDNPADVISVFSDAYTNVAGTNFNPDWGQATSASEIDINGNNTLLYAGLDYQGTEFASSLDVSAMTHMHLDVWTGNSSALNVFLISPGPTEEPYALSVPTSGWASVDIPLTEFSPVDLADLIQLKFDGNGDIYLDNIYFYIDSGGGDVPTVAAPTPTEDPGNVISIFSDAYTNVPANLNPDWGQATVVTEELIDGNNTLVQTGLNYQGIELGSSQDVTGMTHLHLDFWTANSTELNVFLISPGPTEVPFALSVPTSGWSSVDIQLTDFSPVDLTDVFQFKFEGNGDIYFDNIYFYNQ